MKRKKRTCLAALAAGLAVLFSGCGTAHGYLLFDESYTGTLSGGGKADIIYPQFSQMEDAEKQERLNALLREGALAQAEQQEHSGAQEPILLYEAHHNTASFEGERTLCVTYSGTVTYPAAAYPTNIFYVSIIDMQAGEQVQGSSLVTDWELLRNAFLQGDFVLDRKYAGVLEGLEHIGREGLWKEQDAPLVYFTEAGLGISLRVLHALGDHVEYTAPYSTVADALDRSNPCVAEVLEAV